MKIRMKRNSIDLHGFLHERQHLGEDHYIIIYMYMYYTAVGILSRAHVHALIDMTLYRIYAQAKSVLMCGYTMPRYHVTLVYETVSPFDKIKRHVIHKHKTSYSSSSRCSSRPVKFTHSDIINQGPIHDPWRAAEVIIFL